MTNRLTEKNGITRNDVIRRTGVTESQLNAYIAAGILPEPVPANKRSNDSNRSDLLFPASVIWRINLVKTLEAEGESMQTLAKQFGNISLIEETLHSVEQKRSGIKKQNNGFSDEAPDLSRDENPDEELPILLEHPITAEPQKSMPENKPGLTLKQTECPAYFVNSRFEIEWINPSGEGLFLNQDIKSRTSAGDRNIFKLLFGFTIQSNLETWKEMLFLHMPYFKQNYAMSDLETFYQGISRTEIDILREAYEKDNSPGVSMEPFSFLEMKEKNGKIRIFQVQSIQFEQGMLFLYVPAGPEWLETQKNEASQRIKTERLLGPDGFLSLPLTVLSAGLSEASKLKDAMMPGDYFKLLNEMSFALEQCCKRHNGIIGGNTGDWAQLYFLQNEKTHYIEDAINCALDLKDIVKRIKQTGKSLQGPWLDDVFINIGIAEGTEFIGALKSDQGLAIKVLGHTVKHAELLSGLSKQGGIWVAKSGIGKLGSYALEHYEFGIHHKRQGQNRFIPGIFARIDDLAEDEDFRNSIQWAKDLAATQVIARLKNGG
jgi:class 3 adenylate cyclase